MAKKPPYFLKVRSYAKGPFVTIWLIRRDGPAEHGLMWGEVLPDVAEKIAEETGLAVVREQSEIRFKDETAARTPPECATIKQQATLFSEVEDATQES